MDYVAGYKLQKTEIMKFTTIILIFNLLLIKNASCQLKGQVSYELTVGKEGDNFSPARKENYVIYFNAFRSIEFIQKASTYNSIQKENEIVEVKTVKLSGGKKFIFKDFKRKELIVHTGIMFKNYLVNDTLSNFSWKITKERKRILSYNCIKATTQFRGRDYVAWFTEDIPLQNGPWKFCGLPGLIVKVFDVKQVFSYQLISVDFKTKFNENILNYPNEFVKSKAISHKNFMDLYKKKLEENDKLSKVVEYSKNGSYGTVTVTLPQKMEKF